MAFSYLAMDAALLGTEAHVHEMNVERSFLRRVDSPFDLESNKFKKLYRMTPNITHELIDLLDDRLQRNRITGLSAENQVFAALRFYATGCYQRPEGEQNGISMSQSSISRSIHRVTDAINSKIFRPNVRFPVTQLEREAARNIFRNAREPFDGAIGAIDCSQVAIIGPKRHEEAYVNHHGYHSINVQMICNPNLKILNVNVRYPGARHDSYIWGSSAIRDAMKRSFENGDHRTFLIGDSGYPLEPWLMTPLPNQPENSPKFRYNEALCKSRNCVERLFGVLKGTWRCLSQQRVLMYEPGFAGKIVNACAALHNMRLRMLTSDEAENSFQENNNSASQIQLVQEIEENLQPTALARRIQERIISASFT